MVERKHTGHTPGPWVSNDADPCGFVHAKAGGSPKANLVAVVYGEKCPTENDDDVRRANARLIAAAPDLLAALDAIVDGSNGHSGSRAIGHMAEEWEDYTEIKDEALEKARAALAKARAQT